MHGFVELSYIMKGNYHRRSNELINTISRINSLERHSD